MVGWKHRIREVSYDFNVKKAAQSRCGSSGLCGLRLLRQGLPSAGHCRSSGALRPRSIGAKCVGCGKCARECPASVIEIQGGRRHEKALVRLSVDRVAFSICCWAFSISCSPGWACCASSSRWSSPWPAGPRATATATAAGASCLACWAGRFGLSRRKDIPGWMKSKAFRYGFLAFFFAHVLSDAVEHLSGVRRGAGPPPGGHPAVDLPSCPGTGPTTARLFHPGVAQFAFGFYSVMLTSTVLGLITMVLFKPRSWCVYCPMGTMTQLICKAKARKHPAELESGPVNLPAPAIFPPARMATMPRDSSTMPSLWK